MLRFAVGASVREGIAPGDRVAGYLPNLPETIVAALGAAAIGAVWSSCSPDFGVQGVRRSVRPDRTEDSRRRRRLLLRWQAARLHAARRARSFVRCRRSGARCSCRTSARRRCRRSVTLIGVGRVSSRICADDDADASSRCRSTIRSTSCIRPARPAFRSASCTAPAARCIQHLKEHQLLCDIRAGDRVFYFTTCGWMMWNWLVIGARVGSDAGALRRVAVPSRRQHALRPGRRERTSRSSGRRRSSSTLSRRRACRRSTSHRLRSVRTITSTGSPLAPESFDFVYEHIKRDVHLASISGGTDIVGLFAGGNPNGPVWRGEIQARALGMKVEVFDESGQAGARAEGRARLHDAVSVDAGRLLERPGRPKVSRRLLRTLSRRLAPRRLRRADRARWPDRSTAARTQS